MPVFPVALPNGKAGSKADAGGYVNRRMLRCRMKPHDPLQTAASGGRGRQAG